MEKQQTYQHDWRFGLMMRYWTDISEGKDCEALIDDIVEEGFENHEERVAVVPPMRRIIALYLSRTLGHRRGRLLDPDTFEVFCEIHDSLLAIQEPFAEAWLASFPIPHLPAPE